MKRLDFKLFDSARNTRNLYINRLGTDSLVKNRRVPTPIHILD